DRADVQLLDPQMGRGVVPPHPGEDDVALHHRRPRAGGPHVRALAVRSRDDAELHEEPPTLQDDRHLAGIVLGDRMTASAVAHELHHGATPWMAGPGGD